MTESVSQLQVLSSVNTHISSGIVKWLPLVHIAHKWCNIIRESIKWLWILHTGELLINNCYLKISKLRLQWWQCEGSLRTYFFRNFTSRGALQSLMSYNVQMHKDFWSIFITLNTHKNHMELGEKSSWRRTFGGSTGAVSGFCPRQSGGREIICKQ